MQILPITSNLNNYKNYKINNKMTNPVSFKRDDDREKIAFEWCCEFRDTVCSKIKDDCYTYLVLHNLFKKLKALDSEIQEKIILEVNINEGNIFPLALRYYTPAANEIWKHIINSNDKQLQGQFLLGSYATPNDSAYYHAVTKRNFKLANEILQFAADSNIDERVKTKFFNLKDAKGTQYEHLMAKGFAEQADKFKDIANKFKDTDKEKRIQPRRISSENTDESSNNFKIYTEVKTRFSDVGGMFNVKNQIKNELLAILNNPKVKNADKPSGIILYGPPGTGKSLLATAIAGEAGVPFIATEGSSFAEKYVGVGPKNVRDLYAEARHQAENHPSKTAIVFIDEVDAVGGKRGESSNSERDNTLNALLCEMDGVKSKEHTDIKVITILATNRKDMLDSAFRKGRIDLEFKIDDPRFSEKARFEILTIHAKDKPFKDEKTKDKMLRNLARTTSGFSGAELADVIKRAYRKTLYLGRNVDYITQDDINNAKLESMVGIKTDSEVTEYEKKTMIAHEAGHAVNLVVMDKIFENEQTLSKRPVRVLDLVVNEARGGAAGMTVHKPSEANTGRYTIESLMSSLVMTYGGYSIEETLFGCHTDGVQSDLEHNTQKICEAVTKYGLGSKTKYLSVKPDGFVFELYKNDIKKDIETYSNSAMAISNMISSFTKPFIEEYTEKYLNSTEKIIPGETFIKLFETWLEKENKKEEFEQLSLNIQNKIAQVRKEMHP